MTLLAYGGADGFEGSATGNPFYNDWAKPNIGEFAPNFDWQAGLSINYTGYGRSLFDEDSVRIGYPNDVGRRDTGPSKVMMGGLWTPTGNLGTDQIIMKYIAAGGNPPLFLAKRTSDAKLVLYDSSWNVLVVGPSIGTQNHFGMELDATNVTIHVDGNSVTGAHGATTGTIAPDRLIFQADTQTPGKTAYVYALDDWFLMDNAGSKFNQWPTTYPKMIDVRPLSDAASGSWSCDIHASEFECVNDCDPDNGGLLTTNTANDYLYFNPQALTALGAPSACGAGGVDISSETFNAVRAHAGFFEHGALINKGYYAAKESSTDYQGDEMKIVGESIANESWQTWILEQTPGGLPWTPGRFSAIDWGVKSLGSGTPSGKVDEHYRLIVMYGGAGMDAPGAPTSVRRRLAQVI